MIKDKPKKDILSKRVLIAVGIISFLMIAGAIIGLLSGKDPVEEREQPEMNNEGNESEELEEEVGAFDLLGKLPFWAFIPIIFIIWKLFWDKNR